MENIVVRDPATIETTSKPRYSILQAEVYELISLLRDGQISPQAFLGNLRSWSDGEETLIRLNGSKDAFGPDVSKAGGMLQVIKEGANVVVTTVSSKPLEANLVLGPDNKLALTDLRISRQPQGFLGRLRVLARLEEHVRPGDAQKLLDAFLHAEPLPVVSSSQAA